MKITSIQYYFHKYTGKHISQKKVKKFYLPIIKHINNNNKLLIAGSQGIGKSTLLNIIKMIFKHELKKEILSINLDNFYYDKGYRIKLAKRIHPLLKTRGVPGTHNIKQIDKTVNSFVKSKYPIKIPIFDKLTDKKLKKNIIIKKKCKILILEGWCVGCPPINLKYLHKNINLLEKNFDKRKEWRNYYNTYLKTEYMKLFKKFDSIIYLKNKSFSQVLNWRNNQEINLRANKTLNKDLGMSKSDIKIFIQHYEKITRWMMKKMPKKSNLIIDINKKLEIESLEFRN